MRSRRATSPCTRQCAFSAFLARPCCSVSSVASSKPSMSSGERRKACESRLYPLSPRCLTSLHKPEGSMKQLPSSPRGRRPRLPDGHETAALPPLRRPAGRCARRGRRRFPVEGRLRRSAPAPASLPSCRPDPARSAQRPEFAVGLPYEPASDRLRSVCLLPERKRQFSQPPLDPIRFDVRKVLAVYSRCALVGAALGIGMCQDVFTADLVVQGIEAIASFCLRFRV